ncbi:MAG: FGGY-family carbohydrate kinase [Desulfatibacillum sp.]|nr:FGGY-family carbohydrate kinase [Desulfatibacillum sp.]
MSISEKHILAIDHGTSGVKACLVSLRGEVRDFAYVKTEITFLPEGGAEQNPLDWWNALISTCKTLVKREAVPKDSIVGMCVSSTFSSTVAVDKDGKHLMNALTWMDSRGAPYVRELMKGFPSILGYGAVKALKWVAKTAGGPTLSGKDDIAHVLLIQREFPEIYNQTHMFLPSKDYLNLRLTGEFAASFDSMTLFWMTDTRNPHDIRYDDSLIAAAGIDKNKLPPMFPSTHLLGPLLPRVAEEIGLPSGIMVAAGSPDHQCAAMGSGAVEDYQAHLYVGTSSWIQCIVPFKKTDIFHSIASLPTSIPGKYSSVNEQDMAGGCLSLLVQNVLGIGEIQEDENPFEMLTGIAQTSPPGANNVIFTPWLNGERTPVDDTTIRGCLFNLSRTSTSADMVRAVMEGVALNVRWSLKYVEKFAGKRLGPLHFVGGGAKSDLWCQIFADVLNRTIRQVSDPVAANARGAAFIAAVGLGEIEFSQIPDLIEYSGTFIPNPENRKTYDNLFKTFTDIYKAHKNICKRLNRVKKKQD